MTLRSHARGRELGFAARLRHALSASASVLSLAISAVALSAAPGAAATQSSTISGHITDWAFFTVADPAAVRSIGHIPDRWKLALDSTGKARVLVDTMTSNLTFNGVARTVRQVTIAAVLDSAAMPSPEKSRDTSNIAGTPFDLYLLSWESSDQDLVNWVRDGTTLGDVVQYVPGLNFNMSTTTTLSPTSFPPGPVHGFTFTSPSPATSPFQVSGAETDPLFPIPGAVSDFWRETPTGTVKFETREGPTVFSFFQQWQLTTAVTSPLGQMIGNGGVQTRTCDPTEAFSPLFGRINGQILDTGCFGSQIYVQDTVWAKELPPEQSDPTASSLVAPAVASAPRNSDPPRGADALAPARTNAFSAIHQGDPATSAAWGSNATSSSSQIPRTVSAGIAGSGRDAMHKWVMPILTLTAAMSSLAFVLRSRRRRNF